MDFAETLANTNPTSNCLAPPSDLALFTYGYGMQKTTMKAGDEHNSNTGLKEATVSYM